MGDILDVFICQIYEFESLNLPVQVFSFFSVDYPALYHSYELTFGENLTVEYRSINGAPEFIKSANEEGDIVLTAESTDILRINDRESLRWVSSLRSLSLIRVAILQNASKLFFKPRSARPLGSSCQCGV